MRDLRDIQNRLINNKPIIMADMVEAVNTLRAELNQVNYSIFAEEATELELRIELLKLITIKRKLK